VSAKIIPFDYEGQAVAFNTDGWLHATKIADRFGKRLDRWLENAETLEYMRALDEALTGEDSQILDTRNSGYVKTSKTRADRGGGTWLHPKLAVAFARWCDARFSVWCDLHIDALLNSDPVIRRGYGQACQSLEDRKEKASRDGSRLARFRWDKPGLEHGVTYWKEQLQLTLALEEGRP